MKPPLMPTMVQELEFLNFEFPGGRFLFDAMPQLGWVARADGWIGYYNSRWYEYTGGTPEEMQGWGWQSVHDPTMLPSVLTEWRACIAKGVPFEMSFPLRRRDGVFRWFKTHAVPLRDADGIITRWIGINADIDDQKRAEAALAILVEGEAAARERLERLTDITTALAAAISPREVAEAVVEKGMQSAGADTATLYSLDASGRTLELLAQRGIAPRVLDAIRRISRQASPPTFEALASGAPRWVETEEEYSRLFPEVANIKAAGPRAKAFWSLPLMVEGKAVGLLAMGFYQEQRFAAAERAFAETFAQQCSQALVRALRRERESEVRRWLSTTLQSIGDGVIATNTLGHVTFMNAVAEQITGYREDEARGRPLEEIFPIYSEVTGDQVESPVAKVLRHGTVVGLANHTFLRSKSGRQVPIDDSGAPIRDEEGRLYGVVLVFRDVTAEKLAHRRREFLSLAVQTLASSLDYRVTLAKVAQLAVPVLADWCSIDMVEPGATTPKQLAVAHADPTMIARAREIGQRYPPDPNALTGAPNVIRTGKSEIYPEIPRAILEAAAKDADHLRIIRDLKLESAMIVPLKSRDGRTLGAMSFIYAASGRRYSEDDLAFAEDFAQRATMAIENANAVRDLEAARAIEISLRKQAEIANTAKDEFLATVSHELRTPLNSILGWAVILRRWELTKEIDRGLEVIERNARAQARLIEDVLDVSRVISGKLSLTLGPVDVADAIDLAVAGVRPEADTKGVSVTLSVFDNDSKIPIVADADRIQQIFWNLLSNAVKFTPKGGSVTARIERVDAEVRIEVKDTGEGIRPDVLPMIFDPFRQADSSTTRRHGGLGLGLALVKQLTQAHGGSVEASSEGVGRGATFVVRLPAKATVPAVRRRITTPMPSALKAWPADALPRLDGLTVLVLDDEVDARELIGEVLREFGATVHLATSASVALPLVSRIRPDVVVSDIGMPEMDGYGFIRALRAMPSEHGGRTPALALTAYSREEDSRRAFASGYQRHIAKPIDTWELVSAVVNLSGRTINA